VTCCSSIIVSASRSARSTNGQTSAAIFRALPRWVDEIRWFNSGRPRTPPAGRDECDAVLREAAVHLPEGGRVDWPRFAGPPCRRAPPPRSLTRAFDDGREIPPEFAGVSPGGRRSAEASTQHLHVAGERPSSRRRPPADVSPETPALTTSAPEAGVAQPAPVRGSDTPQRRPGHSPPSGCRRRNTPLDGPPVREARPGAAPNRRGRAAVARRVPPAGGSHEHPDQDRGQRPARVNRVARASQCSIIYRHDDHDSGQPSERVLRAPTASMPIRPLAGPLKGGRRRPGEAHA